MTDEARGSYGFVTTGPGRVSRVTFPGPVALGGESMYVRTRYPRIRRQTGMPPNSISVGVAEAG